MSRVERVASAIQREVSTIIQTEINDPRLKFVTITDVKLAKDLRFVRLYYSVLGDVNKKASVSKALKSANGFIRMLIAERIRLRFVPEIAFTLDESSEYGMRIEKVFEEIKEREKT